MKVQSQLTNKSGFFMKATPSRAIPDRSMEKPTQAESQTTGFFAKIKSSNFWVKLTNWEYWPFGVVYLPVFLYWGWLCLKARSFFFFSAANPSIENGGMLGERKSLIYDIIKHPSKPKTFLLEPNSTADHIKTLMQQHKLDFPIILKPDIGERGWMVEKINHHQGLESYLSRINVNFLLQEYIDFPIELGIFYYRMPGEEKGTVSSIVLKEMLTVKGDGKSTIRELVNANARAKLQLETLESTQPEILKEVLTDGIMKELVPIGNHSKGTTFLNGNHLINEQLHAVFDNISDHIEGFYFGRFDIRCASISALYAGKNIKIIELNGAGSEPGHIYHPGFPLMAAYQSILHHLKMLLKISKANHKLGVPYMTVSEGISAIKKLRDYNKLKSK